MSFHIVNGIVKTHPHQTHRWSGWPGAYCLHCGIDDPVEECLADHNFEPDEDIEDCPNHKVPVCVKYDGRDPYTVEVNYATEAKHR